MDAKINEIKINLIQHQICVSLEDVYFQFKVNWYNFLNAECNMLAKVKKTECTREKFTILY